MLNETWLDSYETDLFNIPSFHAVREKSGGGVSILVLKSFDTANQLVSFESENSSFLLVELEKLKIKIATVYRPPSNNDETFPNKLDALLETHSNLFLFGDMNYDIFAHGNVKVNKYMNVIF